MENALPKDLYLRMGSMGSVFIHSTKQQRQDGFPDAVNTWMIPYAILQGRSQLREMALCEENCRRFQMKST